MKLLKEREAAKLLGVSVFMLQDDRKKEPNHRITFCRIGERSIRYRYEDLMDYIEKKTVKVKSGGDDNG
jgi:predicted DNA-binding transcriptional regulator AlpA